MVFVPADRFIGCPLDQMRRSYEQMTTKFALPEWLNLAFFSFFLVLAWVRPLERNRRMNVTALAAVAIASLLLLLFDLRPFAGFRQGLPLVLIPMAYWQTGQFTGPIHRKLQARLTEVDHKLLSVFEPFDFSRGFLRWLRIYTESAYILVYPMVPSAVAVLFFVDAADRMTEFWSVVLPPAYICYATLPFIRTLPPRATEHIAADAIPPVGIRKFNLFIVGIVTHQANTFPSGHAAAAVAVALELLRLVPPIGAIYLVAALSIMAGAFFGRYHYAVDLLAGAALACLSFLQS
jgi:hypothetical protein